MFIRRAPFIRMMTDLVRALEAYGLNEKEAKTYLALLELGSATAARLSEVTGINRTTLYDLLGVLAQKGAVGSAKESAILHFHATPPETLLVLLRRKTDAFRKSVPQLKARMSLLGKRPRIEFYEGTKGIEIFYNDLLDTGAVILGYGSFAIVEKVAKYITQNYRKERIARGIPTVNVTDASILRIPLIRDAKYRKLTAFHIDPALAKMPAWTYIYGGKIAVLSCTKDQPFGFSIESPALVAKERHVFELLLKKARKVDLAALARKMR